jgi:hypothetical protein
MRSVLTVLGITIGIAAVICVVAIGKAGQARVQQQLNNLGDNFFWIEAGGRAVNGVRTGTHDTKTLVMAHAIAIKNQISLIKSVSPNVDDPYQQRQEAEMQTARLHEVVRQKDPELKEAVEQLARGDVRGAIANLDQQGRVHEIVVCEERLGAIAREYVREPQRTLIISADNEPDAS